MKRTHLEEKQQALVARREALIGRFNESARARKSTARVCSEIRRVNDFLATLDRIMAENDPSVSGPRRYAVSSLFLHDCFKKLTADPDEQFLPARRSTASWYSTSAQNSRTSGVPAWGS